MSISAIILAGGRGRRLENQDKGLLEWHNKPLIEHVINRIKPQVDEIFLSCNRNLTTYQSFGLPVITDSEAGFKGPLTGLASTMKHVHHDTVLVLSCDCPNLPYDLVPRLQQQLVKNNSDLVLADDGERKHYLCALLKTALLTNLEVYLRGTDASVKGWHQGLKVTEVDFQDQADSFLNINTPADLYSS